MKSFLPFLLMLCVAVAAPAGGRDLKPSDFAYAIPLQTSGMDAICTFTLPAEVYRSVTRNDLGDICLFNSRDEMVPFTLLRSRPTPAAARENRRLPLFPLAETGYLQSQGLSLQVLRDASGSIVKVKTAENSVGRRRTSAYLVDASSLRSPVSALTLDWTPSREGIAVSIRVEGSDDLEHWLPIVPSASVASLVYGGHTLDRRSIALGGTRMKYLRLSAPGGAALPDLTSVIAELALPGPEQPRQWTRVTASVSGKPGDYAFVLPGPLPVDRVRVLLPEDNTMVTASFFSRRDSGEPWKPGPSALIYRLRVRGEEISSAEIILNPDTDRFRLMRVDRRGGGMGKGTPVCEFGWTPATVMFSARGKGPFRLAYGSGRSGDCVRGGDDLFRRFTDQYVGRGLPGIAIPGRPYPLAGESALRRPLVPLDAKQATLWGVLLLGVALLGWMAVTLHRQMNSHDDAKGKE